MAKLSAREPKFTFKAKPVTAVPLPERLTQFIEEFHWKEAKSYSSTWPHEYIARDKVPLADRKKFFDLVRHIRANGRVGRFFARKLVYWEYQDHAYWTMCHPDKNHQDWYEPRLTEIINRCPKEDTYEARLLSGRMPKSK